jgi:hypothetical protein
MALTTLTDTVNVAPAVGALVGFTTRRNCRTRRDGGTAP